MLLVSLTGGMATGKSRVARMLESLGCHVIHADELGHQVLAPGGEAAGEVVARFGTEILDTDGTINRRRLAALVFDNAERLAALNNIVHPAVRARQQQIVEQIAASEPDAIIVVEAAIHIETGNYRNFDKVILAVCDEEEQIRRAMARDGLSREEVVSRLRRQMPLSAKREYADYVIDTTGDYENTLRQTRAVYNLLKSL